MQGKLYFISFSILLLQRIPDSSKLQGPRFESRLSRRSRWTFYKRSLSKGWVRRWNRSYVGEFRSEDAPILRNRIDIYSICTYIEWEYGSRRQRLTWWWEGVDRRACRFELECYFAATRGSARKRERISGSSRCIQSDPFYLVDLKCGSRWGYTSKSLFPIPIQHRSFCDSAGPRPDILRFHPRT